VLCYHAVSPEWEADLSVTPQALEAQLTMLVRLGWRATTFTEAVLRRPHRRTLAVTFDDGYVSVLERAHPIMTELGLPGTVFVPTSFMHERQPLRWPGIEHWDRTPSAPELQGMNWDDLRTLQAAGWEVGSHTRTHRCLTQLDDRAVREELTASRQECFEHLGQPCQSVAYPYGDTDEATAARAAEAGYLCGACMTKNAVPENVFLWPRVGIFHHDPAWRFALKASSVTRRLRGLK
jgi:peptidoglycan/xylan/chitin deacetylase (PgdA/CDA1 family)